MQRLRSGYCLLKGDVQKAKKYVHRESVSVPLPVISQELALHELQKGGGAAKPKQTNDVCSVIEDDCM